VRPGVTHVYHQYTIRVARRDELIEFLRERDVGSMIHYPLPLHLQKMYDDLGYAEGSLPVSEGAGREVLSLPMYPELTDEQVRTVVDTIGEFLN
jgi:dTDP-4-amino-4,6-dideoxygalactose transaminase